MTTTDHAAALQEFVTETAAALGVPGAAVGLVHEGREIYAFHGVTSLENPLDVDEHTLFQFGSTGKTFTASAIMRLVERGDVELDAPVRTYVPELVLRDEDVAAQVTVLQLLNHTAGWDGDLIESTGDGDEACERIVARMADLHQLTPLGSTVSYNNAALYLAGRVIEKVTGLVFEQAIKELLFEPLGLSESWFFPADIMTRRFAVGHETDAHGVTTVARPWNLPRSGNPAGGISATARDQVAWARFHLSDGRGVDGTPVLQPETLGQMQEPTAHCPGSALGEAVGISWLLEEYVDGTGRTVRLAGHGGTTHGQHSGFVLVPSRDFGLISMTNEGPHGPELNRVLKEWALERFLDVRKPEPELLPFDATALAAYTGRYETIAAVIDVSVGEETLLAEVTIRPEVLAQFAEAGQEAPDQPPVPLGLIAGEGDRYVVTSGDGQGMTGYFARTGDDITGLHLGGRLAARVSLVGAGS